MRPSCPSPMNSGPFGTKAMWPFTGSKRIARQSRSHASCTQKRTLASGLPKRSGSCRNGNRAAPPRARRGEHAERTDDLRRLAEERVSAAPTSGRSRRERLISVSMCLSKSHAHWTYAWATSLSFSHCAPTETRCDAVLYNIAISTIELGAPKIDHPLIDNLRASRFDDAHYVAQGFRWDARIVMT